MRIAGITGQGLSAMALSVFLLWACVIGECVMRRNATAELVRSLQEIHMLRGGNAKPQPAAAPIRLRPRPLRMVAG